jgi:hypothetical protein
MVEKTEFDPLVPLVVPAGAPGPPAPTVTVSGVPCVILNPVAVL